mmetsp:Transcript_5624/g.9367  ORF Transcript_5624/g.9367 Transcript_5624/m.9367 type:complete len:83 (-) Transcript_5624:25-273(-)
MAADMAVEDMVAVMQVAKQAIAVIAVPRVMVMGMAIPRGTEMATLVGMEGAMMLDTRGTEMAMLRNVQNPSPWSQQGFHHLL